MTDGMGTYQTGDVGPNAQVAQGEYIQQITYLINLYVQKPKDAYALLRSLKAERDAGSRYDLLLRRLEPLVLVNRKEELKEIEQFFADLDARVLYVTGLPGIGKSTLVRGALEFRRADTQPLWIMCEGLDADQLLNQMNVGLHLEMHVVLKDTSARLAQRIAMVLGAIMQPSILVLDGFEALLDENGKYASQGMAAIMEALTQLEHKAKVLVSTRRVPPDVGAGSPGIRLLRLGGLSPTMAEALFRNRAPQTTSKLEETLATGVLQKLDGHPKFIELFAAAIADLPVEQVVSGLLTASDIGEYVIDQVLGQLGPLELQVLRAAIVFRAAFSLEALKSVFDAINTEKGPIAAITRKLVRRAVLERVGEPQTGYYVHPLLRDAVPRESASEADAHAAAANWFLREPIKWEDSKSLDDGLYHLRRAAKVGRNEAHFRPYVDFIMENFSRLEYAGRWQDFFFISSCLAEEVVVEKKLAEEVVSHLSEMVKKSPFPSQQEEALSYLCSIALTRQYSSIGRGALAALATNDIIPDLYMRIAVAEALYTSSPSGSIERQQAVQILLELVQDPDLSIKQIIEVAESLYESDSSVLEERQQAIQILLDLAKDPGLSIKQVIDVVQILSKWESSLSEEQRQQAILILLDLAQDPDFIDEQASDVVQILFRKWVSSLSEEQLQQALQLLEPRQQRFKIQLEQDLKKLTKIRDRGDLSEMMKASQKINQLDTQLRLLRLEDSNLPFEQALDDVERLMAKTASGGPSPDVQQRVFQKLLRFTEDPTLSIEQTIRVAESLYQFSLRGSEERQQAFQILLRLTEDPTLSIEQTIQIAASLYQFSLRESEERQQAFQILFHLARDQRLTLDQRLQVATVPLSVLPSSYQDKAQSVRMVCDMLPGEEARHYLEERWPSMLVEGDEPEKSDIPYLHELIRQELLPTEARDMMYFWLRHLDSLDEEPPNTAM